jgi:hypothetical protein
MNKITSILGQNRTLFLLIVGLSMSFFSCKKDDDIPSAPSSVPELRTQIQKRWSVNGAAFSMLEFNNSNQAIVVFGSNALDADSIRSYFYKVLDSKNIEIKNFGKLEVGSISDTAMQFQFTPNVGSVQNLSGKKSGSSVGSSSNTSLFCRTWKMDRWTIDGEGFLDFDTIGLVTATFTSSGTYYIEGIELQGEPSVENSLSWWKWNPSAPGQKICYSHESENFDCDSTNIVSINSLNTMELVMDERDIRYYLQPYNLPGRVAVSNHQPKRKIHLPGKSFFHR